jgi:hypothetical protein
MPGMSPGCSDRERVRGAITMRCFKAIGPICAGVSKFGWANSVIDVVPPGMCSDDALARSGEVEQAQNSPL